MKKIKNRKQLSKFNSSIYGWLIDHNRHLLDKLLPKSRNTYTLDKCKKIAQKFTTSQEWRTFNQSSYRSARKNGWLEECTTHFKSSYWTKDECIAAAKMYKNSSTWKKNDPSSYGAALRNGWIIECHSHMTPLIKKRSLESCKNSALKYKTRSDWRAGDIYHYQCAISKGWIDECTKHMGFSLRERFVVCVESNKIFKTAKEASLSMGYAESAVSKSIRRKCKCGGYRWAYCDEDGNIIK